MAWRGLTEHLLTETAVTSLPHILEAGTDLECSVDLCVDYYYKQAAQVLRGFLEGQVIDFVLARNAKAFANWKSGSYRVPSLGGKNGLLQEFKKTGVLDPALTDRIARAYEKLNSAVHGAERDLVNDGLFSGRHTGRAFRPEKLASWSQHMSEIVEIGIRLMKEKAHIWLRDLRNQTRMCSICRENATEQVGNFSFGGSEFLNFRCTLCGNVSTRCKGSGELVFVVTVSSRRIGSLDEVIASCRAALEVKPDDPETLTELADALAGRGLWDEAIAEYRRVADVRPDSDALA